MAVWCLCLVAAQLPGEEGYSGGKVIFIDTENTLYPSCYHSAMWTVDDALTFNRQYEPFNTIQPPSKLLQQTC